MVSVSLSDGSIEDNVLLVWLSFGGLYTLTMYFLKSLLSTHVQLFQFNYRSDYWPPGIFTIGSRWPIVYYMTIGSRSNCDKKQRIFSLYKWPRGPIALTFNYFPIYLHSPNLRYFSLVA